MQHGLRLSTWFSVQLRCITNLSFATHPSLASSTISLSALFISSWLRCNTFCVVFKLVQLRCITKLSFETHLASSIVHILLLHQMTQHRLSEIPSLHGFPFSWGWCITNLSVAAYLVDSSLLYKRTFYCCIKWCNMGLLRPFIGLVSRRTRLKSFPWDNLCRRLYSESSEIPLRSKPSRLYQE